MKKFTCTNITKSIVNCAAQFADYDHEGTGMAIQVKHINAKELDVFEVGETYEFTFTKIKSNVKSEKASLTKGSKQKS